MIELHPEILTKDGRREFVVLPCEEFEAVREELKELEDLRELRAVKAEKANAPTMTLAEARRRYGGP
jgi:PHD/YefM family antitoxin component YafN of YafNO toxin-antitoxin module